MKIRLIFVSINIVFILTGCQLFNQSPAEKNLVLATYSKTELGSLQLTEEIKKNSPSLLSDTAISFEKIEDFTKRFIDYRLKVNDGYAKGLDKDSTLIEEFKGYKKSLATAKVIDGKVKKDLVDELYGRKQISISASHILVMCNATATPEDTLKAYNKISDAKKSIRSGMSFDTAAETYSEEPGAKQSKGSLGWFSGGEMVYTFENAAFNAPIDSVYGPIRTSFGYHLLQVHKKAPIQPDREISHIMFATAQGFDSVKAKFKADSVLAAIKAGADYNTMAQNYSDDGRSKVQNGFLGLWRRSGRVPQFDTYVYDSLKTEGQISNLVKTRFGYHIIRLEKIKPLKTKDEMAEELNQLITRQTERIEQKKSELAKELIVKNKVKFNPVMVDSIAIYSGKLKSFARSDEAPKSQTPDSSKMEFFMKSLSLKPVMTDKTGNIEVKEIFQVLPSQFAAAGKIKNINDRKKEIEKILSQFYLDHFIDNLDAYDPEFKSLLGTYMDGLVLFKWLETQIWKVDQPADEVLMPVYEKNKDEYKWDERGEFYILNVSNYAKTDSILNAKPVEDKKSKKSKKVKEVLPPQNLKELMVLLKANKIESKLDTVITGKTDNENSESLWKLSKETQLPTMISYNGSNVFAVFGKVIPLSTKSFEEAKQEVFRKYYDETVKSREESTIADLRKNASIAINNQNLNEFVAHFKKK